MRYRNPVIPGFHPDPSICRVDDDYYLVTSTFEYFPGVPVFHSRDLVNYERIGHCLTRRSQLPLDGCACSGGIYAPTIRHHSGRFFMITTNTTGGGNFIVTADDPAGEWSEPVWIDIPGIDPSLLFDDDGKVYYSGTGHGDGIWQSQIDVATGRLLTERRLVWPGTGGSYPEAPHLYHIGKVYYLMIAEGGTEYGHMETIARADNPWGPFEPCPHNPILSHRDRAYHEIQATGHADLVQAADGNWWLVFLGIRCPVKRKHHLGRETFLAPVTWTDGWPVVGPSPAIGLRPAGGNAGTVELEMDGPLPTPSPVEPVPAHDDFDAAALRGEWNFIRNPNERDYSLTERPGWLRLRGSAVRLEDLASPAFVGRRQQHFDCRAACLLDFTPSADNEEAGLVVLGNGTHHYEIAVTQRADRRVVIVRRRIGDLAAEVACETIADGPVTLAVDADAKAYTFSFSQKDIAEKTLATGATRYLSTEVCGGFTGTYLGIYATGHGKPCSTPADFDGFAYAPVQTDSEVNS